MTNAGIMPSPHVLVVEDDERVRETCEGTLRSAGYEVATASTIEEAWRAIEWRRPDLVVLDRRLADGSGDELVERWRGTSRMRNIPVIMITTRSSDVFEASPRTIGEALEPHPRDTSAVLLRSSPASPAKPRRTAPRASLALVHPCGDDHAFPALDEHEGMLQARCGHCLRGSPTLGDDAADAARHALDLGWAARKDGWTCPVCIERHKTARH